MTQDKNHVEPQAGKPSWFQLVDSDAPSAQVAKVNRKLPVIALFVTGAIAASGTFFANASDGNPGTVQSVASTSTAVAAAPAANAVATSTPATVAKTHSAKSVGVTSASNPTTSAVQNPSQGGVQAPRGGGDDDEDKDDDDHYGREGHERGDRDHDDRD